MLILRKIKEKIKKVIRRQKDLKEDKKVFLKKTSKERIKDIRPVCLQKPEGFKRDVLGVSETKVEKSKFFTPETPRVVPKILQELSSRYGQDKIVLQTRDSWWIHAYWEVTPQTIDNLKQRLGNTFYSAKIVLRVYDVSHIVFNGTNAHRFFDVEINYDANSWYIDTAGPGRAWCVDIGLRLATGEFIMIVRSNTVDTPLECPSWVTDEEWMIPEEMFTRLYGMGFGFGRSSPAGKAWQERVKRALFSGVLASPGLASMASPVKKVPKARKFWMVVNTELIVYGATEPDAKVTVQGNPIKLRPDGTFSLRFALPDGKQVIPVQGTSADDIETITITPIVGKETKYNSTLRE